MGACLDKTLNRQSFSKHYSQCLYISFTVLASSMWVEQVNRAAAALLKRILDKVFLIANNRSDLTQMKEVSGLLALGFWSYPLCLPYMDRYLSPEWVFAKAFYQFYWILLLCPVRYINAWAASRLFLVNMAWPWVESQSYWIQWGKIFFFWPETEY